VSDEKKMYRAEWDVMDEDNRYQGIFSLTEDEANTAEATLGAAEDADLIIDWELSPVKLRGLEDLLKDIPKLDDEKEDERG
jgi:hypothetical protein